LKYELDLFGVMIPSFLVWSVVAYALARMISKIVERCGLYRQIWHPALFDFAIFVCLTGCLIFICKEFAA
jgi:hypothetical protein